MAKGFMKHRKQRLFGALLMMGIAVEEDWKEEGQCPN